MNILTYLKNLQELKTTRLNHTSGDSERAYLLGQINLLIDLQRDIERMSEPQLKGVSL